MRTFIGIRPDEKFLAQVKKYIYAIKLQDTQQALHFTPDGNFHVTLRFLGNTSAVQSQTIIQQLNQIIPQQPVLQIKMQNIRSFFVGARRYMVFLSIQPNQTLSALQQLTENIASTAGFKADKRSFYPHITLARKRKTADNPQIQFPEVDQTLSGKINQVIFYQALTSENGSRYLPIHSVNLAIHSA